MVKYRNDEVIRIVMVGKTGAGKSASGNTILGRKRFESRFSPESLTEQCDKSEAEMDGQKVAVIDTPGLFDTSVDVETTKEEVSRCVRLASPGPHIFLIVIKLGRFTEEEKNTVKAIQTIFGEETNKYSMVLFTGGDQLEQPIEEFLEESEDLQDLVDKCNGQYHVFNNKEKDRSQVNKLLRKIKDITKRNGGSHYTNEMFQEAERAIEEEKQRILKEKEEEMRKEREKIQKEIEKKFEGEISKFKDDMKRQSELLVAREKEMENKMREMKREHEWRARQDAEMKSLNSVIESLERALNENREEIRRLRQQAAEKGIEEKKQRKLNESISAQERELKEKIREMEREQERRSRQDAEIMKGVVATFQRTCSANMDEIERLKKEVAKKDESCVLQ